MREFLAQQQMKNWDRVNHDLFDRKFDKPLVEFILDSIRNIEAIPGIKLESWELVTDQTKIKLTVNKRLNKDTKIKNNKQLERLVPMNGTLTDLLVLNFVVSVKGITKHIQRRMLIFKEMPNHYYVIGGKRVTIINQVVDNSTFVKGDTLKFKTNQNYSIDIRLKPYKMESTTGEKYKVYVYRMDLFGKESNPIQYFLARYGVMGTIDLFSLSSVVSLTAEEIDTTNYLYYKICDGTYLEVNRKAMDVNVVVPRIVGSLIQSISGDPNITRDDVYQTTYWLERLSELFVSKRQVTRGEKALISFKRILDPTTQKRLAVKRYHKYDSHMLIRWLLVNYDDLMRKNNHDLKNKRVRGNECIAYYFDSYITKNIYSLLNATNPSFDRYERLLNVINETVLLKAGRSGIAKGTKHSIYRYETYNDFTAINALRYSLKGPNGLNGGKNGTSMKYLGVYPSHIGRYDTNVCSSASPGLTGYLAMNCQLDENGYFDAENSEPDVYDYEIEGQLDAIAEPNYANDRKDRMRLEKCRNENGFIVLPDKKSRETILDEIRSNADEHGVTIFGEVLMLNPVYDRDSKGFIKITKTEPDEEEDLSNYKRNDDGFIILEDRK